MVVGNLAPRRGPGVLHTSVPLIHPIGKLEYRCVANSSQMTWTRLFWGLYKYLQCQIN